MDARARLGRSGEDLAAAYYRRRGYDVLDRNYRCAGGELDLVLRRGRVVVFCEVKTRSGDRYGTPIEAVQSSEATTDPAGGCKLAGGPAPGPDRCPLRCLLRHGPERPDRDRLVPGRVLTSEPGFSAGSPTRRTFGWRTRATTSGGGRDGPKASHPLTRLLPRGCDPRAGIGVVLALTDGVCRPPGDGGASRRGRG